MTTPTFLGIGAPRCGSTWLYKLLLAHPQVYVPPNRKQVSYFTVYYDRGLAWYESFFPIGEERAPFKEFGEFTPDYLYEKNCAEKLLQVPSIRKLILIIRNPCDRLYSSYRNAVTMKNYRGSFESFMTEFPHVVDQGFYSKYLNNFLQLFGRQKILILVFEDAVRDVTRTKKEIARFLQIDDSLFPPMAGEEKVNESFRPRAEFLYGYLVKCTSFFRYTCGLDRFADWYTALALRLGLRRLLRQQSGITMKMPEDMRRQVGAIYKGESGRLETLTGIDLHSWKSCNDP
jgi:hypothetical protein